MICKSIRDWDLRDALDEAVDDDDDSIDDVFDVALANFDWDEARLVVSWSEACIWLPFVLVLSSRAVAEEEEEEEEDDDDDDGFARCLYVRLCRGKNVEGTE